MSLVDWAKKQSPRTDKYDLGYIHTFYASLFDPRQESTRKMLEIGIYRGDSIRLWQSYFPHAHIHAADVQRCPIVDALPRVTAYYEDAYNVDFVNRMSSDFDIIIDDGPHTYASMVFFLTHYAPLVRSGGLLILEDIIDREWTPSLVGLLDSRLWNITVHDMRQKQLTTVLYERWKNGLDVIIAERR